MLVSVIIPVYNGEEFIKETLESVLAQNVDDMEVIVVDDCSEDGTEEAVKSLGDPRINYFKNDRRIERSESRNKGFKLSQGMYIFFLDHDDRWKEGYLESSIEVLKQGADAVYSVPREYIDGKGKVVRVSRKRVPSDPYVMVFGANMGFPSASGFRRESFPGFRSEYILREDWELFVRMAISGKKIEIIDNNKVQIRDHGTRSSRKRSLLEPTLRVWETHRDSVPEPYRAEFTFHVGLTCLRYGKLKKGWSLVAESILRKPSLLKEPRNILYPLKWGFRLDRSLSEK